jgi:hypothetical protein
MRNRPADLKQRALPEQADIVWGEHVLPNFRKTHVALRDALISLESGDDSALGASNNVESDFKGQSEFATNWMTRAESDEYARLMNLALVYAANIGTTEGAYWGPRSLGIDYDAGARGQLEPPDTWPSYELCETIIISTGEAIPHSGIYVPDAAEFSAQYLCAGYGTVPLTKAFVGYEDLVSPETGEVYGVRTVTEKRPCRWTLCRRASK